VFLIVLTNEGFNQTFSPAAKDKYLARTLPAQGELVENYYSVTGGSLANEIAMVSGQGPTVQTENNCPTYTPIKPFRKGANGQIVGDGCVYPKQTPNLAEQLVASHHTWKSYVENLQSGPHKQLASCGVPALNKADPHNGPSAKDPYVTWRNPFVYFASLTAKPSCRKTDVPLTQLASDLKSESTTPSLSYIVPSPCDDGDPAPCHKGAKAGLAPADVFLKKTLKLIEASPAYKSSGLIAITFDHAQQTGPFADQSSCCSTPTYPNVPTGTTGSTGATGTSGATGATGATGSTSVTGTSGATGSTSTTSSATGASGSTGATSCAGATGTSGASGSSGTTGTSGATGSTSSTGLTGNCGSSTTTVTPVVGLGGGETNPTGGGGQVGLLLISQYVKPNQAETIDYFNHFSLLASIQALFGIKPAAFTAETTLPKFSAGPTSVYSNF